ncbi:MAG: glycosyltransferase family 4 protein [Ignavibacteria bacterium]|nr:glycosyltransferase family 4 protein [Ignavibacteria bacterium]MBT8381908.1 glycosyltransferase family 4 protein [Ignavibacteria bacterium]MBT8390591.1 glycosyltransferase family 4 protein [Ignavibacteria bacterium]NNL22378.1 glycosyltransferase family 4 protein [Ignavibacteriaceae bacterium]
MSSKQKVLITFLGNINYDTRCKNLYDSLLVNDFEVSFLGFDWLTKDFKETHGEVSIYKLKKGFLSLSFYLKFIWHLKLNLIKSNAGIFFAEDIYTLPFVVILANLKRAKVFYDSRELFGHLAGLKDKKLKQIFWRLIEKLFINKADYVIVTGEMDEKFIKEKFNLTNTIVLRNLPRYYKSPMHIDLHSNLQIDKNKKIILYQGIILKGRGIELIYKILKELPEHVFVIVGGGDFEKYYKELAVKMDLVDQVYFLGKLTQEELPKVTAAAHVGTALIENLSLSYYYALPNKLFEYIMAEVPVFVSDLPQMKEIVEKYEVGFVVNPDNADEIVSTLKNLSTDSDLYDKLKQNCTKASEELNWEKEVVTLLNTIKT